MVAPSRRMQAVYLLAIAGMFLLLSNSDYADARRQECGNKSTQTHYVEWDSKTDRCIKEKRHAQTPQNR